MAAGAVERGVANLRAKKGHWVARGDVRSQAAPLPRNHLAKISSLPVGPFWRTRGRESVWMWPHTIRRNTPRGGRGRGLADVHPLLFKR